MAEPGILVAEAGYEEAGYVAEERDNVNTRAKPLSMTFFLMANKKQIKGVTVVKTMYSALYI